MQPLLAVRIKDGIFVGNVTAASDASFLSMNKVSHIVNCAAMEIGNTFQTCGIKYLALPWRDAPGAPILEISSSEARTLRQIRDFVDGCLALGECVLIHSILGVNRCCVAASAYFMSKYKWNFDSTVQYLTTVHPYMGIKPYFNKLLRSLSKRISASSSVNVLSAASEYSDGRLDGEQQLLRNTYLNALSMSHPKNTELRRAVAEADFAVLQDKKPEKAAKKLKFSSVLIEEFAHDAEPVSHYNREAVAPGILTKKAEQPVPAPPQSPAKPFGWASARSAGRTSPSPAGRASPNKQQKQANTNLYCFEPSDGFFEKKTAKTQPKVRLDRSNRGEKANARRSFRQQLYKELARGEMIEEATANGDALSLCAIGLDMFDNARSTPPPSKKRPASRTRARQRSSSITHPPLASTY